MSILLRLSLLSIIALMQAGCQGSLKTESSHYLDVEGPIAIDVQSFGGDVFITGTDEGGRASVEFERVSVHGKGREKEAAASLEQITTNARIVPGEMGQVLQVRAVSLNAEPHYQRVHIHITAPIIDGVTVLTRRGKVYVTNIAGEVDVETTVGDVRVITAQPLLRPVTVINTDGDIDYRVRGESRGAFDCEARSGAVLHRVRFGQLNIQSETDHDTLQAILNGGDNPVRLRTVNGDIRIAVVADPEAIGLRIVEP